MRIGIVGSGKVGSALAKRLGAAGHQTMLSFNKDANDLNATARRYGARTGTPHDAASFGEVVVLAVPWNVVRLALRQAGSLRGKVLWDCTNALKAEYTSREVGTITSGGEIVSRLAPGARVVKAIPPSAQLLLSDNPMVEGKPVACLLCSDDAAAKATVMPLVNALPAQAVDFGPLSNARFAEPAMMVIVRLAFGLNRGYRLGFALLTENIVAPPGRMRELETA
jgi:8-hydroxy-5-deazaflavin:NADPH oxidoreductase